MQWGTAEDIEYVVLATRHANPSTNLPETLSPIREFPCFVYIARSLVGDLSDKTVIKKGDLQIMA